MAHVGKTTLVKNPKTKILEDSVPFMIHSVHPGHHAAISVSHGG